MTRPSPSPRYYPTDLLLAIQRAERALIDPDSALTRLLRVHDLSSVGGLFAAAELTEALDLWFGGLSQYPWQPLIDSNDVDQLSPVGTIVLDDHRVANTLRGLLFAWAAGNHVLIRSRRDTFWQGLTTILRDYGFPLPEASVLDERAQSEHRTIHVPDLVPVSASGAAIWNEPDLYGDDLDDAGNLPIRLGVPVREDAASFLRTVASLDARASWTRALIRREYLAGTRLADAREADDAHGSGRLDAKLRYLIGQARRTPYYRDLPQIHGVVELAQLPILEKRQLDANTLPLNRNLYSDAPPSGEVLRSGATSGDPRYIVYSRGDWANMVREAIPLWSVLGLRKGDRVINTLFAGSLYGGSITSSCEFSQMAVECYTTTQACTVDDLLMLHHRFRANTVIGLPTLLMPLLRKAKAQDPALRIEKVLYGGTPMAESDKAWLREHLDTDVVASVLAANDGAQLGFQCPHMGGTLHHICDDYNLLEVVDDDGQSVPDGEVGHLLITSLQKFEAPLVRYRIGDIGRVFHRDCACGLSGRVMEYLGRSDGIIKFLGSTVRHRELHEALETFEVSQLQVEIDKRDGREALIARIESARTLDPDQIRAHLIAQFHQLRTLLGFGDSVFGLVVECHPEGALRRDAVSGKVKTVIDRRLG